MPTDTTVVSIQDVSKRFVIRKEKSLKERLVNFGRSNQHKDDFWALREVSLDIEAGTTVGLIGPNGSGKSTLLKLIGGIVQPTSGNVLRRGRLAALLELGAGFHPDLTGRENVYLNASILGLSRSQTDAYFDAIVDFSGIEKFIDTQVKFYSSGMYVRLAFAVAVHVDPDVLLVDEVLAVGDEPFQRKCMDRIRRFQNDGRTIVLVTHSLDQVAELCDRAIVLEHGAVVADGAPKDALRHLRADFEATRIEERARENVGTTSPQAKVLDVRLVDATGAPLTELKPGDSLDVVVDIEAETMLQDWILGVGVDSPLGQVIFGTNTKLMGVPMEPFSGRRTFTVRLPELWLGEGMYGVHAAIAEGSGAEIDRKMDGPQVQVMGANSGIGFLHVDAQLLS